MTPKKEVEKPRLVKVIWDDHGAFAIDDDRTWAEKNEIIKAFGEGCFIQNSIGYIVFDTDTDLILAQSIDQEDGMVTKFAGFFRIIKHDILEIINLKEEKCIHFT